VQRGAGHSGLAAMSGLAGRQAENSELLSCRTIDYFSFSFYLDIPDKADGSDEIASAGVR
jgi:hypothetical protein